MRKILLLPIALLFGLMIASAPSQACACCGTWKVINVANGDVLNIRSGPGADNTIVGTIPSGSACVLKSAQCEGKWCRVAYDKTIGWVNTRYLRFMAEPE